MAKARLGPDMQLTSAEIMDLRRQAHDLDPILQVGKAGMSDAVVEEITRQLKRRKLVKVKLLRSALEAGARKDIGTELAAKTRSALVEVRGNTVVLWKGRRKTQPARSPEPRPVPEPDVDRAARRVRGPARL